MRAVAHRYLADKLELWVEVHVVDFWLKRYSWGWWIDDNDDTLNENQLKANLPLQPWHKGLSSSWRRFPTSSISSNRSTTPLGRSYINRTSRGWCWHHIIGRQVASRLHLHPHLRKLVSSYSFLSWKVCSHQTPRVWQDQAVKEDWVELLHTILQSSQIKSYINICTQFSMFWRDLLLLPNYPELDGNGWIYIR